MTDAASNFTFNEQQTEAIESVVEWFKGLQDKKHSKMIFFLAGYAGTGKTSCAKEIAERCGGSHRVVFIAPTGKAASRLRQKGCKWAKTLHQFIYNVRGEDEEGDPIFLNKGALDEKPWLIILDEASMVGAYDLKNLMQHNIPVLALGDIGQIPPVKQAQVFTADKVDFLLDKIERNAGNIVRASMVARDGKRLPFREYEDVRVRQGWPQTDAIKEHAAEEAVMLCSYNTTRQALNRQAREALGFDGDLPQVGEKIVCMFNQHGFGIMNGEQGIVVGFSELPDDDRQDDDHSEVMIVRVKSLTDGKERNCKFNPLCFTERGQEALKEHMRKPGAWDFGYALTIHKSQGSEWPHVLVVDEIMSGVPYSQLSYTAYTRAMTRLTVHRKD